MPANSIGGLLLGGTVSRSVANWVQVVGAAVMPGGGSCVSL